MRPVIFRSLVVLFTGLAVLIGVLYVASTVDARAPEVIAFELTQPVDDDADAALITTSLEVTFNETVEVDPGAMPVTLSPEVAGSVSWSGSTMIFTPRDPLELATQYVATVSTRIRDLSGNPISETPATFTFMTAGRPTVVATLPADGAARVPVEEPIRVTFSTLMDTGSVEAALSIEPAFGHELRWSGVVLEIVPDTSLRPNIEYELRIDGDAADVAGVPLGSAFNLAFRTVAPGLMPVAMVPAEGVDGIAPASPIAVIFDRPLDLDSVSDELLTITPEVAGSLQVVTRAGDRVDDDDAATGVVLRFAPAGPLALNTTFEVSLAPGLRALDGGLMAEGVEWSFTTGAPAATLSNHITFVSERSGVANVWAMNADGSGQRQVSSELTPVTDYAVAPDGSRLVVADGRRLIRMRADGSDRRVLTDEGRVEFDPAFAPNGERLAFGRADAETGEGLGLWLSNADGGDARQVELPLEIGAGATPSPSGEPRGPGWLRAPRFSPDGQALAFVDPEAGTVGILELPAERLTSVAARADVPPIWLPDSSGVLAADRTDGVRFTPPALGEPIEPLVARASDELVMGLFHRSGTTIIEAAIADGAAPAAIDRTGRIALILPDGGISLKMAQSPGSDLPVQAAGARILAAAFAPGEEALVIVVAPLDQPNARSGRVELLHIGTGERTVLAPEGSHPRWLP